MNVLADYGGQEGSTQQVEHGSAASRREYDRHIAEWLGNGRSGPVAPGKADADSSGLTVVELIDRYWQHVQTYYRKADGSPTSEVENFRQALRPLLRLYGHTRAADFSPLCLKALRGAMKLISDHRNKLDQLASALLRNEVLERKDIDRIMEGVPRFHRSLGQGLRVVAAARTDVGK